MASSNGMQNGIPRLDKLPEKAEDLDRYEIEHLFHSWAFQSSISPKRIVSAKGIRFTDEAGKDYLDFSSCFVSHNIGHQDPRVVESLCTQAQELCSFAPTLSQKPRALLAKMLAEVTPGDLSRTFFTLGGTEASEAGIKILTGAQATRISEVSVTVKSGDSSGELLEADSVVVAVGMAPRREEAHQLAGECADVHIIGDCVAPGRIRDAVVDGDLAGRLV